ncbi:MAG: murein DD-endopeptidase MepM/ murein hydrolase activator NlpD [Candidatus Krumholzibacteriia bacterium]
MGVFGVILLVGGITVLRSTLTSSTAEESVVSESHQAEGDLNSAGQLSIERTPQESAAIGRQSDSASPAAPVEMIIGEGESFYDALIARQVSHTNIMKIVTETEDFRDLRDVQSGEIFRVLITPDGTLQSLGYDLGLESHAVWVFEDDKYVRHDGNYPVEHLLAGVCVTIESSLYASLQTAGAPLSLAPKMNDIMGWDIDFKRDLRQGDTFRILYEEVWKDGARVRTGGIQAIEMVNKKKMRSAFLFTGGDHPHYYDSEGRNMQKQLLRAPINYSRISAGFSHRRFHPVHKKWMPHLGVDYAAPIGTPVRAGGDGEVLVARYKKGNGNYIQIRHTNAEFETYYLHLSKYAKGIKPGAKVSQGQIIGYVGSTGYASGPHLDYRVKRDGTFVDARQLKLPAAAPVPDDLAALFSATCSSYAEALDELSFGQTVTLQPTVMWDPPAWDRVSYAQMTVPAGVRSPDI